MTFELATPGEHWPSGDYVDFAVLDIDESDLGRVFSKNLQEGSEEGMGPWKAVGFKLRDGATVEIIRHERSLEKGFVLRRISPLPQPRWGRGVGEGVTLRSALLPG